MNLNDYNNLVKVHSDGVYRFAIKHLNNADDANEVVQFSFEKLWIKHREIQNEKSKSYLFTVAWHQIIDMLKERKRTVAINEEVFQLQAQEIPSHDLMNIIEKGLNKLPEIQKTLIMLRDYEGYSYDEMSTITKLSEQQVKVYLFRARQTLKVFLGKLEAVI